jgi:hypothetical protein
LTQFFYKENAEGQYVVVNGEYVEYNAENAAHTGLTRYNVDFGENTGLMQMLAQIVLRFQVLDDITSELGFRIAANLAISPLINKEYILDADGDFVLVDGQYVDYDETNAEHAALQRYSSTTLQVLLEDSQFAIELFNGKYQANNDPVLSVYLNNGVLYVRVGGTVRVKLDLLNVLGVSESGSGSNGALATADGDEYAGLIPANILSILNGALAGITINSTNIEVNIGTKLISAILGIIPAIGDMLNGTEATMPELNAEYSKIGFGQNAAGNYELYLSLGIDPIAIGVTLDGFKVAFSQNDIFPISEEEKFETEYTSLGDLTTLNLQASIGLDVSLYESNLQLGDLLSSFISGLSMSLGVNFEDDVDLSLVLDLSANVDISDANKTELALEIFAVNSDFERTLLLGAYIWGDTIYVNFAALSVTRLW